MCNHKRRDMNAPCQECRKEERRPKPKPRTPVKKVSAKQAKRLKEYAPMVKELAEKQLEGTEHTQPVCEVALMAPTLAVYLRDIFTDCSYYATQHHHDKGRIGQNLLKPGKLLCENCHRVVELRPLLAKELNLSESRLKENL